MQRDIFDPQKMSGTGMIWRPSFDENAALRYDSAGKYCGTTHREKARGAGSMATNVSDLGLFIEALLAGKLLKPETQAKMFAPQTLINSAHQFPTLASDTSPEGPRVGLAYGLGWGLLTTTPYGPAYFKEGHGDGAQNYLICFPKSGTGMIILTNSDNGEMAFRSLLEKLIGDNVTPWEWEGYNFQASKS